MWGIGVVSANSKKRNRAEPTSIEMVEADETGSDVACGGGGGSHGGGGRRILPDAHAEGEAPYARASRARHSRRLGCPRIRGDALPRTQREREAAAARVR